MSILSPELLETIHSRAERHDRENTFPHDDVADLKDAGYFTAFVPKEFGGAGLSLPEMTRVQRQLAGAAPGTALGVNMHQVWVGVARVMHAAGLPEADFIFDAAMNGEIFGFGISERGNDLVLFGSTSEARPDGEGGYTFHGTKIFTSLSPVWTMLGTFGMDTTGESPKSVYGFVTRNGGGVEVKDDWDAVGMRASQSCTTVLDGAPCPPERVLRRLDPGPTMDPLIFGIFSNFEILLASVYTGIAERALEVAADGVAKRHSVKNDAPYSNDPDIRWRLASAAIQLDGLSPQIETLARDVDAFTPELHGALWLPRLSALKVRATETARDVVDEAIRSMGGSAYFNRNELSRLYRDVLAGIFHPSDDESAHAAWANALLGPIQ
ncbi:Acyl-CoA dehydrogenase [Ruaniaceae bacterium KH17]|nr:Acyl-CoA dehydrogenase [Ruaniaceae bacterium KH17]